VRDNPSRKEITMSDKPPIVKSTDEVRQGETSGRVRWVLGVSLVLVVLAMIVVYFVVVKA
jgi:hypothetical protein